MLRHIIATALAVAAMPALAEEPPRETQVEQGLAIVSLYCADCHAIGPEGDSPHAEAPPFRTLHLRYDVEWLSEALVEGLVSGHPDMPEFEFDPAQAEAIVVYLKSLE